MRYLPVVMLLVLSPLSSADAQISIQIGIPSVSIGFSQPYYPELVAVPGYPVYYAPGSDSNFFFYDGLYWVYEQDNWYASSWYNGPWSLVAPYEVPVFILRVPVLYYRHPPTYFGGWQRDAPPRWGDHWGHDWERQRGGWDRWDRRSVPAPAPLPVYQRQYSGNRYPQPEQQHALRNQNYRHEPSDNSVKRVYQEQRQHAAPAPAQRAEPARQPPRTQEPPARATPHMQQQQQQPAREAPRAQPPQPPVREMPHMQQQQQQQPAREAPRAQPPQQPAREMPHMQQQQQPAREAPRAQPGRAQEQDKGQQQGKDQGRERDR